MEIVTVPKLTGSHIRPPPKKNTADSQLLDFATESLLYQCVHGPTRFRVNQVPSLLDLLFIKFPNLTSPITVQPPLGKSDHALLQWPYTSAFHPRTETRNASPHIIESETQRVLEALNPNKGAGPDGLFPKALKTLSPYIAPTLSRI